MTGRAPGHLLPLAQGWSLWRWLELRSAGLSAERVAPLACSAYAAEVDRWIAQAERLERELVAAAPACPRGKARKRLYAAIEALKSSAAPQPLRPGTVDDALAGALAQLRTDAAALDARWHEEQRRVREVLREAVAEPLFREAVTWQNRRALHTGLDALAAADPDRTDGAVRAKELLVAGYLQRYSTKNDEIGFFGPCGFGTLSPEVAVLELRPGPGLVEWRQVRFEHWCVAAIASTLSADPDVKAWIAPRLSPAIWLEGEVVHHPTGATGVPAELAALLAACDGETSAVALARALVDRELGFSEPDEVYAALEQLEDQGLVIWALGVPSPNLTPPEHALRATLERIADEPIRARALGVLDTMDRARDALADAAGDAAAVDAAAAACEQAFTSITGNDGVRNAGQLYAGRTLFYEDCRRDVELQLGPGLFDRTRASLALVLQSARWYTAAIADGYRRAFREVFERLRSAHGAPIPYARFGAELGAYFELEFDHPHPIVAGVFTRLQQHWGELLRPDVQAHRWHVASADLAARATEVFAARGPGWPSARYHCLDLSIAAASVADVQRGAGLFVLGELHTGANILAGNLHPTPHDLIAALDADLPRGRVELVSTLQTTRGLVFSTSPHDFDVELGATPSGRPRSQVIPIGALVVDEDGDRLVVRTRDRARSFDIVVFHERRIAIESGAYFRLLPPARHMPRVVIDDALVINRERWTFSREDLAHAHAASASERFRRTRRWARDHGIPRFAFYKVHEERKPWFLDLDSPILVEMFVKQLRKTAAVTVSEMLPGIEQLWLEDAAGRRYTSELRIPALDPVPWAAM